MLKTAILTAALAMATVATAAPTLTPSTPADAAEAQRRALESAVRLAGSGQAAAALAIVERELAATPLPSPSRARMLTLQARLLIDLNRTDAALTAAEAARVIDPDVPQQRLLLIVLYASKSESAKAQPLLIELATRAPQEFRALDVVLVSTIIEDLEVKKLPGERFELLYTLTGAGYTGGAGPGALDDLYAEVIRKLLAENRQDEARARFATVQRPEILIGMASDLRYKALHADVEARLGANMKAAVDRQLADGAAAVARSPGNGFVAAGHIGMLRMAGRPADAETLGRTFQAPATAANPSESLATLAAIAGHAHALADLGKLDEADRRFTALPLTDLKARPDLVPAALDRAELMSQSGRHEAALGAVAALAGIANDLSDTARARIAGVAACSQHRLGRAAAAAAALAELEPLAARARYHQISALSCMGRAEQAAAATIAWLGDDAERANAIYFVIPELFPWAVKWMEPARAREYERLIARPDVKAAYLKVARPFPTKLIPKPPVRSGT